uniref:Minor tail protein n=1 Tax=Streptomyces phage Abafar TaxID=3158855 RepID=A0AAU7GYF0_9CAUD
MAGKFKKGARCSSACPTRDHRTFGECMRAKNLNLNPNLADTGASKAWDGELQAYRDARAQGIQPAGTTMNKVREAVEISQTTGKAFQADAPFQ